LTARRAADPPLAIGATLKGMERSTLMMLQLKLTY
jgi:hypothetical protein